MMFFTGHSVRVLVAALLQAPFIKRGDIQEDCIIDFKINVP